MLLVTLLAVISLFSPVVLGGDHFYSLEVVDIQGNKVSLSEFKDKVVLVVNVASECGYTDLNYRELVKLQTDFQGKGFSVLGFPCNQFGKQEPASNERILKFAKDSYSVNFPMFSRVDVLGNDVCNLYRYLYSETGSEPSWNFCKYLVDWSGNIAQFFSEKDSFDSIRQSVEYLLYRRTEL